MFGLWSVGRIYEYIAGSKNFILLYIFAGITGNICSFAFIPSLSVGASSSLFGILFCLYIIQKYEEKIAYKMKNNKPSMQLGSIILINVILNIGFGIFTTIFDWAAHLGGALAGTLFGFALTTRHNWNLKIILSEKKQSTIKKHFFDYYQIYYFGILLVNILFLTAFFNVKNYQILYGKALENAASSQTKFLSYSDLSQYEFILTDQNNETNPKNILADAIFLHKNHGFFPAEKMYEVLLKMLQHNFLSPEFSNENNKLLLAEVITLAKNNQPLPQKYENTLIPISRNITADICTRPAELFMTLGYYEISGNLYECAFLLSTKNETLAIKAIESFYLAGNKESLNEILSLIRYLDKKTAARQ